MSSQNVGWGLPHRFLASYWLPLLLACVVSASSTHAATVSLVDHGDTRQSAFGADEIREALWNRGHRVVRPAKASDFGIVLCLQSDADRLAEMRAEDRTPIGTLKPEGFSIRPTSNGDRTTYWVVGADAAGVMYGGLELAEIIRVAGLDAIEADDQNPYMAMRGTKFNCP
ncbi:MAG: hypothetical protein ACYTAS_18365, partial [Planctomycetota bacterium]